MICDICKKFEGDSTTYFEIFIEVFEVIESKISTMAEYGTAKCKSCGQKITFHYDEILTHKMRIRFID